MKLFNFQNFEKLIKLLQSSRTSFKYDHSGVKNRLLSNIQEQQMSLAEQKIRELTHKSFLRKHRWTVATTFSLLLIVGSGAIISQADVSKPGDKLHVVDELGERIILTLPLSEAQKIDYQTKIVDERTNELDYLLEVTSENTVKKQAIKQSQESLDRAIEQARNAKEKSSTKGDRTKSERYDKVLKQLDTLAEEQEMKIKYWRDKEKNEEIKREYDRNLELLKKSRNRAQSKDNSGSDEDHE